MTDLERLASAVLLPGFEGAVAPEWIRREAAAGLGGVVLFSRNVRDREGAAQLVRDLRAESPDLLIGIDEEGGDVTRLEVTTGSSYPGAFALGQVDDVELTRGIAREIGSDLAEVGIDLDLAPVADVNSDPENPVIGIRSFGATADLVARHVAAFVAGLQETGVAACAKHFPGHGETHVDSHHALPVVDIDPELLRSRELVPFAAAVEAGVRSIMTAHLVVPAIAPEPATLSRAHLTDLLRRELGFDGVVITDALEMRAVAGTVGMEESAVLALAAGADALCLGAAIDVGHVARTREAIVGAVTSGRLAEARLVEAAERVAALQSWTRPSALPRAAGLGLDAARRARRVEGDVRLEGPALVVELAVEPGMAAGPSEHGLGALLQSSRPDTRTVTLGAGDAPWTVAAHGAQIVVVTRDLHRNPWQGQAVAALVEAEGRVVVVDVGLPVSASLPGVKGMVTTCGAGRVNLEAACEALIG